MAKELKRTTGGRRVTNVPINKLKPYRANARLHPPEQVRAIAKSIEDFGFNNPVLIDAKNNIVAGHGRVEAAKLLGLKEVPCVRLDHLSPEEVRAYIIADNKTAEMGGWDESLLIAEVEELSNDFNLAEYGLAPDEIEDVPEFDELETDAVEDTFYIVITGPLEDQAHALKRLQKAMEDLPAVDVEIGTVKHG